MLRLSLSFGLNQLRDTAYSTWTVLLPPVSFVALALVFPRMDRQALFTGVLAFTGLTMGFINLPIAFHSLVESGTLKRMRLSPRGASRIPVAIAASGIALLLASFAVLTALAAAFGALPGRLPLLLAAWELWFAVTAVSAGFLAAFLGRDLLGAKSAGNLFMLGSLAISGVFFRLEGLPGLLHVIVPAGSAVRGMRAALLATPQSALDWVVPLAWAAVGVFAAAASFRRALEDVPMVRAPARSASRVPSRGAVGPTARQADQGRDAQGGGGVVPMAFRQLGRRLQLPALDVGLSMAGLSAVRLALPGSWQSFLPVVLSVLLPVGVLSGAVWDLGRMRETRLLERFALAPRGLAKAVIGALVPSLTSYAAAFIAVAGLGALLGAPWSPGWLASLAVSLVAGALLVSTIALFLTRIIPSALAAMTWAPVLWLAGSLPILAAASAMRPGSAIPALLHILPAVFLERLLRMAGGARIDVPAEAVAAALWALLAALAFQQAAARLPGRR